MPPRSPTFLWLLLEQVRPDLGRDDDVWQRRLPEVRSRLGATRTVDRLRAVKALRLRSHFRRRFGDFRFRFFDLDNLLDALDALDRRLPVVPGFPARTDLDVGELPPLVQLHFDVVDEPGIPDPFSLPLPGVDVERRRGRRFVGGNRRRRIWRRDFLENFFDLVLNLTKSLAQF